MWTKGSASSVQLANAKQLQSGYIGLYKGNGLALNSFVQQIFKQDPVAQAQSREEEVTAKALLKRQSQQKAEKKRVAAENKRKKEEAQLREAKRREEKKRRLDKKKQGRGEALQVTARATDKQPATDVLGGARKIRPPGAHAQEINNLSSEMVLCIIIFALASAIAFIEDNDTMHSTY